MEELAVERLRDKRSDFGDKRLMLANVTGGCLARPGRYVDGDLTAEKTGKRIRISPTPNSIMSWLAGWQPKALQPPIAQAIVTAVHIVIGTQNFMRKSRGHFVFLQSASRRHAEVAPWRAAKTEGQGAARIS